MQLPPLQIALALNIEKLFISLLRIGACIFEKNLQGLNALDYAVSLQRWTCIKAIISDCPNTKNNLPEISYSLQHLFAGQQFVIASELINKYPSIDFSRETKENQSLLHLACINDAPEIIVKQLLKLGANVNAKDKEGNTPLHIAIELDRVAVSFLFINEGADLTIENNESSTPVSFVGYHGRFTCLETMIEHVPSLENDKARFGSALLGSMKYKQFKSAELIIKKIPNVCIYSYKDTRNTTIHMAVLNDAPLYLMDLIVNQVVKRGGTNLNSQNNDGNTALHLAVLQDNSAVVELFLKAHADYTLENIDKQTPISLAGTKKLFNCLGTMLETISEVKDDKAKFGSSLLDLLQLKEFKLAKRMLEKRKVIDCNWSHNNTNNSTLHWALFNHAPIEIIQLLIKRKVKLDFQNSDGNTPLHVAVGYDNITDPATIKNRLDVINLLVRSGADPNHKNKQNQTPLDLACASACVFEHTDRLLPLLMAIPVNKTLFEQQLFNTLNLSQFIAARKILEIRPDAEVWVNPENSLTTLHVAVLKNAPLDLIHLIHKMTDSEKEKAYVRSPLQLSEDKKFWGIRRILKEPRLYTKDLNALREFIKLYHLGHWIIFPFSKEVILSIIKYSGYDDNYVKYLFEEARLEAESSLKRISDLQIECTKTSKAKENYKSLLDEFGECVPQAIIARLSILEGMGHSSKLSRLSHNISHGHSHSHGHVENRIVRIIRLSRLLIFRGIKSPLAYYLLGVHGYPEARNKNLKMAFKYDKKFPKELNKIQRSHIQLMLDKDS